MSAASASLSEYLTAALVALYRERLRPTVETNPFRHVGRKREAGYLMEFSQQILAIGPVASA